MMVKAISARKLSLKDRLDVALLKFTVLPSVLLVSLTIGILLWKTHLQVIPSVIVLSMAGVLAVASGITLVSHNIICKTIQGIFDEMSKQLESSQAQLIEETAKAEHAARLAALGEMAGGIAHEINNPISVISLLANSLEESAENGSVPSEKIIEIAKKIEGTAIRVSKIIRGLKSFSRNAESDPFEEISIENLFEQILDVSNGRLYNSNITLQLEQEDPKLAIECRVVQISQVFVNLLNNAIDAVEGIEKPWIRIKSKVHSDQIEFRITDCGSGMSPEIAGKIFTPFFTTKEVGKGTGLGLSISLGIIKQHQGSISIDLNEKNTTFVILLPKVQANELKKAS